MILFLYLKVLLIFGQLTDTFTGQATNICNLNYTVLNEFCPPNVTLTYDNIITDYMYVNSRNNQKLSNRCHNLLVGNVTSLDYHRLMISYRIFVNNRFGSLVSNDQISLIIMLFGYSF